MKTKEQSYEDDESICYVCVMNQGCKSATLGIKDCAGFIQAVEDDE